MQPCKYWWRIDSTAQSIGNLRYIFYYKIKTQMRRMKDLSMKYIEVNQQDKKVFFSKCFNQSRSAIQDFYIDETIVM